MGVKLGLSHHRTNTLRVFQNRVPRRIFKLKREKVMEGSREDCTMRSFLTVCFNRYYYGHHIKEEEIGMACRIHGKHEKCIQNFGWKTWREISHGRPRFGWEDNIRMDPRKIG
jgi:hypothetical protein